MAIRVICDCGCGKEITGRDAGREPVHVASRSNVSVTISVDPGPGLEPLNIRPECAVRIAATGDRFEAEEEGVTHIKGKRAS